MPDQDKSFMPDGGGESDWHWVDAESYNPLRIKAGYDGQLHLAMQWIFDNIVQYLEAKNWTWSVRLLGAICHFTADATCPLHATWNFNPGNHHSDYETAVNNHISEISIPDNYVPQYLDNITYAALVTLAESFSFTREGSNPGDNNLTDFLLSGIYWNDWIKSMTENRVRAAVQFTANVWYSAMIQAGLTIQAPTLTSPSNGSSTTDNTPTFAWTSVSGTSSYDFQLASDNNFTINARTVKNLATNSYTPVNPLTNGGWYWHVRTGDNSADVGLWSLTQSFTVTVSTTNPVVAISPSDNSGANGAVLSYTVTVTNAENVSDNFNLTASDNAIPSWGPIVSPTSLTIPAGENRTATLSVTVPSNAVGGTIDNLTVTANGTGGSGSASCTARVTNVRSVNVSISPSDNSGANGATLNYTVTINNTGNVSDNFSLISTDNSGWSRSVSPTSLVAPAFGNGNATLTVTVPSDAIGGTVDNVKVTATGTGDNGSASCTAQVTIARSVSVSISPPTQENDNGGMLTYIVKVNNTGNVQENFQLSEGDNSGWTLSLDNNWLLIPKGENRTTKLIVNIPANASDTWDNIWVQANSQENTAIFDNKSCLAQVRGIGAEINLVAGWNLVCFSAVSASDTPNNMFTGLEYYMDYFIYYWSAPNGPYNILDPDTTFRDNIGYWIWINQDKTVVTSGTPAGSRDVYLVTGWNLVGFPVVNSGTTPDNIFTPLSYYTDYFITSWRAPGGPYDLQSPDQVFDNVLGYWIWINQDRMVTVP